MGKPTKTPEVSVVIPAYNATAYLCETVKSVVDQTFTDWELVIVDDGSTDATLDLANALASENDRIRVYSQPNRGVSGARNEGYRQTSPASRYVIFLDQDDLLETRALEILIDSQQERSGALLTFGDVRYIDGEGQSLPDERRKHIPARATLIGRSVVREDDEAPLSFNTLLVGNLIQTPGVVLIPRVTRERIGAFDARLLGTDDYHYWLRVALVGELNHHPDVVLKYRVHPGAVSRDHRRMIDYTARTFKILLAEGTLTDEQRGAIEYVYTIRNGIGADRAEEWHEAERLLSAALKGRALPGRVDAPDLMSINMPLLAILGGDLDLSGRILQGAAPAGEDRLPLSPDEARRLRLARKTVISRLAWIHSRLAARAVRNKDISRFARELSQTAACCGKLALSAA